MSVWDIVIAIEDYPQIGGSLAKSLPGTNEAATEFYDWLTTVKKVPPENIFGCAVPACKWRTTGNSRSEILKAFADLVFRAHDQAEELYVYFSGHGVGFAEEPDMPAVDILVASGFSTPAASGGECVRLPELKEKLRVTLGPGKHFYFIDACRNPMGRNEIAPLALGQVWSRSALGNATTFVLFSTAPGDVASVGSGFGASLVGALSGKGRAKTWVQGEMFVTFDSLSTYMVRALRKNDLDPERKGPADGNILWLQPRPRTQCDVEVIDAASDDEFTLSATDIRDAPRDPIAFRGPSTSVSFAPDDYRLQLMTKSGAVAVQIDPMPVSKPIDLYEDRKVRFQTQPPAIPPVPSPLQPTIARVQLNINIPSTPGLNVSIRQIGKSTSELLTLRENATTSLAPGSYMAELKDSNYLLRSKALNLSPGEATTLDFTAQPMPGAQTSLANALPTNDSQISFSETLNNVPDWDLSLWLAVLGGSRLVAAPDVFSKLADLKLETFANPTPGKATIYVLAGETEGAGAPACGIGLRPMREALRQVEGIDGLFELRREHDPGSILLTYAQSTGGSVTVLAHGLADRATFLTFVRNEAGGVEVQQFLLPIHSRLAALSQRELDYLQFSDPLPLLRYMSTAQRLFARQIPVEGNAYFGSNRYWSDLLYAKWLNPLISALASYELIRRGQLEVNGFPLNEVVMNMHRYFPTIPDNEVFAALLDKRPARLSAVPLMLDGLLSAASTPALPLPEAYLDFSSIWICWREAIQMDGPSSPLRPFRDGLRWFGDFGNRLRQLLERPSKAGEAGPAERD